MAYKDEEEFFDALFDHIFDGEDDITDEDQDWFDNKVAKFWDQFRNNGNNSGSKNSGNRRRSRSGGGSSGGPRRKRRTNTSTSTGGSYGNGLFFGGS